MTKIYREGVMSENRTNPISTFYQEPFETMRQELPDKLCRIYRKLYSLKNLVVTKNRHNCLNHHLGGIIMKSLLISFYLLVFVCVLNAQNNSAFFDGSQDRIRVTDASPVNPNANPSAYQITGKAITVEAWIYPMSLPKNSDAGIIVSRPYWSIEPWQAFELRIDNYWSENDDPRIEWIISDGNVPGNWGVTLDPNPPVVGGWTHIAGTYDGSKLRLYINGNLVDESDYTANIGTGTTGFYIGGLAWEYFNGLIDEVRLWNVVRTQSEIQSTMNGTLAGTESGLNGYWPMDSMYETSSGILAAVDKTSNHNDLAVQYDAKLVPFPQGSTVQIAPTYVRGSNDYALTGELFSAKLYIDGWPVPSISVTQKPSGMIVVGDSLFWTPQENQFGWFPVAVTVSNSSGTIVDTAYVFSDVIRSAQNQVCVDVTHRGKLGALGMYEKGILYKSENGLFAGDFSLVDRDNAKFAGGLYSSGSTSFNPIEGFTTVPSRFSGFTAFKTSFTDEWEMNRIGVRVFQTVHSSTTTGDDKYAILEYSVVNESGAPIGDLFAQLTTDFDIGTPGNNLGEYDSLLQMTCSYEPGGADNPYFYGFSLLNQTVSGVSIFINGTDHLYVRTVEPCNAIMPNPTTPGDYRNQISTGPFNLAQGETLTVAFAVFAGDSLNDIKNSAVRAKQIYNYEVNSIASIKIDSLTAYPLDTVNVPVNFNLTSDTSVSSAEFNISGYIKGLEYLGIDTAGTLTGSAGWSYSVNEIGDSLLISWFAGAEDITSSGIFCKLKFRVIGDACSFIPINIQRAIFNTGDNSVEISNGGVSILPIPEYGDVDENGLIQAYDASLILKHVIGLDILYCQGLANADVTDNGSVSALDASVILQYGVGLITSLPYDTTEYGDLTAKGDFTMTESQMITNTSIEVPVFLSNGNNILSFEGCITYDTQYMELSEINWPTLGSEFTVISTETDGLFRFAGAGSLPDGSEGTFIRAIFTINEPLGNNTTEVVLQSLRLNEEDVKSNLAKTTLSAAVGIQSSIILPTEFSINQNHPNPFNPVTNFKYAIPQKSDVKLNIYNVQGQIIETLVNQTQEQGSYKVTWDASGHSAGVYLYRITAGQFTDVKKCILLK